MDRDRFHYGSEYSTELPGNLVTKAGTNAVHSPDWTPSASQGTDGLAYGMYVFALEGLATPWLELSWVDPPSYWECFVGIGNQTRNCWEWYVGDPYELINVMFLADCLDEEGNLLLVVAVTGQEACELAWLRWGNNVPPEASLQADPPSGHPPLSVSLDASASVDHDGSITDYEWDLNDDDQFSDSEDEEDSRGSATTAVYFPVEGDYTLHVKITDSDGASDVDSVTVSSTLPWTTVPIYSGECSHLSMAIVDGNPAVSFCESGPLLHTRWWSLKYLRSTTADGEDAADWEQAVTIEDIGESDKFDDQPFSATSLAIINGRPAVSYWEFVPPPVSVMQKYARATTSTGANSADWSTIVEVDANLGGLGGSLAQVAGTPAIAYQDPDDLQLIYARSTSSSGENPMDWHKVTIDMAGTLTPTLAVVDGNPAIAYQRGAWDDLAYARSATATGGNAADWSAISIETPFPGDHPRAMRPVLGVVAGNPAICLVWLEYAYNTYPVYLRAVTTTGSSPSDWTQFVSFKPVDYDMDITVHAAMALVSGKPAIAYATSGRNTVFLASSSTASGGSDADWQVEKISSHNLANNHIAVADMNGSPGVVYSDWNTGLYYVYYSP